jgi:hypothetical protein
MSKSYHVYGNGGAGGPVDYTTVLHTTASLSWSPSALAHGSSWIFAVRAFDTVSGLEEKNVDARVPIAINGSGADITNLPLAPQLVSAWPIKGGGIRLAWKHPLSAARLKSKPTGFHVYASTGGTLSYATPAATVGYSPRGGGFSAVLSPGAITAGSAGLVGVRAFNSFGEETNTTTVAITPDATAPSAVVGLAGVATASIAIGPYG